MPHAAFSLPADDGLPLQCQAWQTEQPPSAVIVAVHGMAEHIGRYAELGRALNNAGIALYGYDQRGHGLTAQAGTLGLFALEDGWDKAVNDVQTMARHVAAQHPHTPLFLLGHSMGSYIAQAHLMHGGFAWAGAVLSGSNFQPAALYKVAGVVAWFETWRQGPQGRSALIDWLSFGSFNKAFRPNRTAFDWLSRDPAAVDRYVNDTLCGFRCTNRFWQDLLCGLQQISNRANLARIAPALPILIIGGECDPVSAGKRLKSLRNALAHAGSTDIELHLYAGARHELFNETNRAQVTSDLLAWLQRRMSQPGPRDTVISPQRN